MRVFQIFCYLFCNFCLAQNIVGKWSGSLEIQNTPLPLVFTIQEANSIYTSTMDSPAQGAKGIIVNKTTVKDSSVAFLIKNIDASYQGIIKNDTLISGIFKQAGYELTLELSKSRKDKVLYRPQEPLPPYPYRNENVTFKNKHGNELSGTLSLLEETGVASPVVILISGSGPQNRDSEIFGHKPFLVIADDLVQKGIAVLRFDERGVGQSEGNFKTATTLDFANDVEAAVSFLLNKKNVNFNTIGLIGHSEGGLVASMVAARSKYIDFAVLLGTPGIPGDEILYTQSQKILEKSNIDKSRIDKISTVNRKSYDLIKKSKNQKQLRNELEHHIQKSISSLDLLHQKPKHLDDQQYSQQLVDQMLSPWFLFFVKSDPKKYLKKMKCPVLAVYGENDVQVLPDENLIALKKAFKKRSNKDYKIVTLPALNHLFQQSKTGLPGEYGVIKETFSPVALQIIGDWIVKKTNTPPKL